MSDTLGTTSAKHVKRVKTGCVTCRIRRVKCDEEKPACRRCVDTGRKCDGYSNLPFSRRDLHAASKASSSLVPRSSRDSSAHSEGSSSTDTAPLARIVTDPAFGDVLEKRYFQFFRQKTVASTNALMDSRFWDRIVLQVCHTEPAVKYAVLALSAMHQIQEARHDLDLALQQQAFADRYYQKALVSARNLMSSSSPEDIDRVLIACIVFICFESVKGNYRAVQVHTGAGRAILRQHESRLRRWSRRNDLREIQQVFGRLDISAIAFSDASAPYPYRMDSFIRTHPNPSPDAFNSMDDARASLVDHVRWGMILGTHIFDAAAAGDEPELARLESERLQLLDQLSLWRARCEQIVPIASITSSLLLLTLLLWHQTLVVQLNANFHGPETRYDSHVSEFAHIVAYGEEIMAKLNEASTHASFGIDLGIVIPHFLVVQRCRDPLIRRRALTVMRTGARQEGAWEGAGAAEVIERWMLTEEAGLSRIETAADIPEWKRLHHIDSAVDTERGVAQVAFGVTTTADGRQRPPSVKIQEKIAFESLKMAQQQQRRNIASGLRPFSMSLDNVLEHRVTLHDNRELYG